MENDPDLKQTMTNLELLERDLSLKQLQINRLLEVTQAINNNLPAKDLFKIYTSILDFDMEIRKLALIIKVDDVWKFATSIGLEQSILDQSINEEMIQFERLSNLKDYEYHPFLKEFDLVVPTYHKKSAIAFAYIGGLLENDDLYEKARFITTITNIVAVAIENKRLFKQQIEQEKLKREVELAAGVQSMLIPSILPKNELYELDGIYMPHFGVGGDYYDFIKFNENEFIFCIADISGKGVGAALLMANFQANLQALAMKRLDPKTFMRLLNNTVLRITKADRFITFFIARYNTETRQLTYINAGHNPPLMVMGDEMKLLDKGCTILGAFEELDKIDVGRHTLDKEATIVLYTDGLTDLRNMEDVFFEEKLLREFTKENSSKSAFDFNMELIKHINNFKGDCAYSDDITVLTTKIF